MPGVAQLALLLLSRVGGKQKIKKAETISLSTFWVLHTILRAPNHLHLLLATLELASTLSRRFRKVLTSRFTCGAAIFPHFLVVRHLLRGRRGPVASFTNESLQLQAHVMVHRLGEINIEMGFKWLGSLIGPYV